jgi:hypothetical protein
MRRASSLIAVAALFAALLTGTSKAQTPGHEERKVVSRVAPFIPKWQSGCRLAAWSSWKSSSGPMDE